MATTPNPWTQTDPSQNKSYWGPGASGYDWTQQVMKNLQPFENSPGNPFSGKSLIPMQSSGTNPLLPGAQPTVGATTAPTDLAGLLKLPYWQVSGGFGMPRSGSGSSPYASTTNPMPTSSSNQYWNPNQPTSGLPTNPSGLPQGATPGYSGNYFLNGNWYSAGGTNLGPPRPMDGPAPGSTNYLGNNITPQTVINGDPIPYGSPGSPLTAPIGTPAPSTPQSPFTPMQQTQQPFDLSSLMNFLPNFFQNQFQSPFQPQGYAGMYGSPTDSSVIPGWGWGGSP